MADETVVNIDISNSTLLKVGKTQAVNEAINNRFHSIAETTLKSSGGEIWLTIGDCIIAVFPVAQKAITGCIEFLGGMADLNRESSLQDVPLFVRIGIEINKESSLVDVPPMQRSELGRQSLDRAGHLQKRCPAGGIVISLDVYNKLGPFQSLFRPTPNETFFVLQKRPLVPQEESLVTELSEKQKRALPALRLLSWDRVRLDENITLKNVRQLISDDLVVVLGDTSSKSRGILSSAATSDTVGLIEALATFPHPDMKVGIDEWEDTVDLVADRNVIVVGSGATNMYALIVNDIFDPLRFIRSHGQSLDRIVAGSNEYRRFFGRHADPPEDAGLIVISKSVFNPKKIMVWMAGITGLGTQAVEAFFKDLIKGQALIDSRAIGCVIGPRVKSALKADISDYYRKWRISDYEVVYSIDRDGKRL